MIIIKVFEIRFYLTEAAYKAGNPAHKQTIKGSREVVAAMARSMMQHSQFKYYEIVEK